MKHWIEIQVIISKEAEELIPFLFYEIGAEGVAIESYGDLLTMNKLYKYDEYINKKLVLFDPEKVTITGYLNNTNNSEENIEILTNNIKQLLENNNIPNFFEINSKIVHEEDWANNWKEYFHPTKIGENIIIKPTWEGYNVINDSEIIIEIDPGMAFGTGTHETTTLCIEALEKYINPKDLVIDIGCGSGILSLVAAKLGAREVVAVDIDPLAVQITDENIGLNQLDNTITVYEGNLTEVINIKGNIILANILSDIIIDLTNSINNYLETDGYFIASGIILNRLDDVIKAITDQNINIVEINKLGEWACIIAQKN
jgi:ribosomal protein L11 methyltransferase